MKRLPAMVLVLLGITGLVGFGVWPSAGPDEGRIVATAGETEITAEVFRRAYTGYLARTGVPDRPGLRRAFLDELVASRLLIAEMRAGGIEQEAAYTARQDEVERKLLLEAYLQHALFDTLSVSEADLRAAFVRANTQVKARHLYARTREQAEVLQARLRAGESFEALAREVFDDPRLAGEGGSLGYFGFDEMDPAFEEVAFSLPVGVVSAPVRTAQGYSILQVVDRFTRPLLTEQEYVVLKERLRPYVRRRKQQQARRDHLARLEDALALTFHDDALAALLGQVTGQALAPDAEAFEAWLRRPLVGFGPDADGGQRRTWTLAAFRDKARFTATEHRASVRTHADLVDFVTGLVLRETMLDRARRAGLAAAPAFTESLRTTMDEWVLTTARQRLGAEVTVPDDSVRAYYAAAADHEFVVPARVQVSEIVTASKAEAEQVKAQLAVASFASLARLHSIRADTREHGGDLGFLRRDQLGALGDLVFEAEAGTVLGPLDVEGQYVLLKAGARREARPMTEAEARAIIGQQLRHRMTQAHLRAAYEALRAKHPVHIDTDLLYSMQLTNGRSS